MYLAENEKCKKNCKEQSKQRKQTVDYNIKKGKVPWSRRPSCMTKI